MACRPGPALKPAGNPNRARRHDRWIGRQGLGARPHLLCGSLAGRNGYGVRIQGSEGRDVFPHPGRHALGRCPAPPARSHGVRNDPGRGDGHHRGNPNNCGTGRAHRCRAGHARQHQSRPGGTGRHPSGLRHHSAHGSPRQGIGGRDCSGGPAGRSAATDDGRPQYPLPVGTAGNRHLGPALARGARQGSRHKGRQPGCCRQRVRWICLCGHPLDRCISVCAHQRRTGPRSGTGGRTRGNPHEPQIGRRVPGAPARRSSAGSTGNT